MGLAIASAGFHAGEVGVAYAPVTPYAAGGTAPYAWTVSAGALPAGLAIGSDGTVSGKPTRAGPFHFTLQVADSAGVRVALTRSVAIAPALKLSLVAGCATRCSVEIGCVTVCGRFGAVSGGLPPYRYALVGGNVPNGTSQSGLSLTGTFGGSPSRSAITVAVTDALGVTKLITAAFYTYAHVSLASGTCDGGYASGCSVRLKVSGGLPGVAQSVRIISNAPNGTGCYSSGPPPPGYGLTVAGGYVTVSIPGNLISGYGAIWRLVITDKTPCGPSTNCASAPDSVSIKVLCG